MKAGNVSSSDEYDIVATKNNLFNEKPDLSWPSIRHYFATRMSTLLDIPIIHSEKSVLQTLNLFPALLELTAMNWSFYFLGFLPGQLMPWISSVFWQVHLRLLQP